jgi:hypothetical protein
MVFNERSAVPYHQLRDYKIRVHQGVPEFDNADGDAKLVILDDLFNDVYSKDVCDLFTKASHHRNISVILIT